MREKIQFFLNRQNRKNNFFVEKKKSEKVSEKSGGKDLNHLPSNYESCTVPTELTADVQC